MKFKTRHCWLLRCVKCGNRKTVTQNPPNLYEKCEDCGNRLEAKLLEWQSPDVISESCAGVVL